MGTGGAHGRASRRRLVVGVLAVLPFLVLLAACGGEREEGTGVSGASSGTVAGFGSVTVDGIRYDNNAADVVIGGVHGFSVDNLDVGMRGTVKGPINDAARTGTAQTILVEREISGPLDNNGVDNALNTVRVVGQAVSVNPGTWYAGFDNLFALQALQPDNGSRPSLEVHGMRDGSGVVHATYVRKAADNAALADNVFLRGAIDNINIVRKTFAIGAQRVDFNSPSLVKVNWPALGTLDNGDVVDVTGTLDAFGGAGTLSASRIELDNALIGRPAERAKVDGYVISGSLSSFAMNGPRGAVAVTAPTVVPTGGTFAVGARVLAEGTLSGAAVAASRLSVRRRNAVVIEGAASGVNAAQKSFTMVGKTVVADGLTEYKDNAAGPGLPKRTFAFGDIGTTGTFRIVGGFDAGPGKVSAARIERTSLVSPPRVTVQGPVGFVNVASGTFTLLGPLSVGITVFGGVANTDYFREGHAPVDLRADFMALIDVGTVVRVRGGIFTPGAPGTITEPGVGSPMEVEIVRVND